MKSRKSFAEHLRNQGEKEPIQETLFSKGYAIAQNAQHNAATQKINSLAGRIASLANDAKREDDPLRKIDKLSDAVFVMSELFKTQSQQSTSVKNVVVAHALFSENSKK
jgi:cob(I)alamin adenosyltransferase